MAAPAVDSVIVFVAAAVAVVAVVVVGLLAPSRVDGIIGVAVISQQARKQPNPLFVLLAPVM